LGKTLVASDLPVFRKLLTHQEDALLINPEDSDEFAGAVNEFW
jgi:hypothetical protein